MKPSPCFLPTHTHIFVVVGKFLFLSLSTTVFSPENDQLSCFDICKSVKLIVLFFFFFLNLSITNYSSEISSSVQKLKRQKDTSPSESNGDNGLSACRDYILLLFHRGDSVNCQNLCDILKRDSEIIRELLQGNLSLSLLFFLLSLDFSFFLLNILNAFFCL